MVFGYDIAQDAPAVCVSRELREKGISSGCLLFGYGTVPDKAAVYQDSITKAVESVAAWAMDAIEKALQSNGATDLHYVATHIMDAIQRSNRQIREVSHCTGQGIFVGGVIVYFVQNQYILFPFGGGTVYTLDETALTRQANADTPDGLIQDAIGCRNRWTGRCWHGSLAPGSRMFGLTSIIPNPKDCIQQLRDTLCPTSHTNTASMMLRRMLEGNAAAVMELRN